MELKDKLNFNKNTGEEERFWKLGKTSDKIKKLKEKIESLEITVNNLENIIKKSNTCKCKE